jgi:hypothetical protein
VGVSSEPDLNCHPWGVVWWLWREQNWRLLLISWQKVAAYWLSIDQVYYTRGFALWNRTVQSAGVGIYLGLLFLAIAG